MKVDPHRPAPPNRPGDDSRPKHEPGLGLSAVPLSRAEPVAATAAALLLRTPAAPAWQQIPPPAGQPLPGSITHAATQLWRHTDTASVGARADVRTVGCGTAAGTATHGGATWISPLLQQPVEFPGIWIPRNTGDRYRPSRSRARRLLDALCGVQQQKPPRAAVVVAHPDDEAIGAGARLCVMPDAHLIHVTDGAPRDPAYARRRGFQSRDAYASSRHEELMAALRLAGVAGSRAHCLGVVDGEATDHLVELTWLIADHLERLRPEIVLTHPYEGGHTDHDATAFAVHVACELLRREGAAAPVIFELTSYHLHRGVRRVGAFLPYPGLEERTVDLAPEMQERKRAMYDCFVSQRACLAAFPHNRERFRLAPRYVFTHAPHPGQLLYERVSHSFDGARWRAHAARALEQLRARRTIPRAA